VKLSSNRASVKTVIEHVMYFYVYKHMTRTPVMKRMISSTN